MVSLKAAYSSEHDNVKIAAGSQHQQQVITIGHHTIDKEIQPKYQNLELGTW